MPITTDTLEGLSKQVFIVDYLLNGLFPCQSDVVRLIRKTGAIGLFGDRYGEVVKVYTMGDFSKEICGGPHAENTGELGRFVITKEQSSSSGVRRIKAELRK